MRPAQASPAALLDRRVGRLDRASGNIENRDPLFELRRLRSLETFCAAVLMTSTQRSIRRGAEKKLRGQKKRLLDTARETQNERERNLEKETERRRRNRRRKKRAGGEKLPHSHTFDWSRGGELGGKGERSRSSRTVGRSSRPLPPSGFGETLCS